MHSPSLYRSAAAGAAVLTLLACGDPVSPSGDTQHAVSFAVSTGEQLAGASLSRATSDLTASGALRIAVGKDTLIIDSIRVVLAQVTLAKTGEQ